MKYKMFIGICLSAIFSVATAQEIPDFINQSANLVSLPANADSAAWVALSNRILTARDSSVHVNIMHIGDSHIQAEIGTSRLRERLQGRYGNGGRGLISAFQLAGTNQPVDYSITADKETTAKVRLLKQPWDITPGFTGVASSMPETSVITFKNLKDSHHFDYAEVHTSRGKTVINYPETVDSGIYLSVPNERIYGVYTHNSSQPGIVYSTIGNNGACFSDYLLIDGFADDVATFNPDLIILSMGTNEGFSPMTDEELEATTRQLIDNLRQANPQALMMVWTPMECHKKDDKDRFKVNKRVKEASDIIAKVAREEGLALWDFYEVAGGKGCAQEWLNADMMNPRDHVHLLGAGYRLQGDLAADAFISFFERLANNND